MEIVKLVEAQRPTHREVTVEEVKFDKIDADLSLSQVAQTHQPARVPNVGRNAPCPCGSKLKFKRCCANLAPQARAA